MTGLPTPTDLPDYKNAHVVIVGDLMLDRYWHGDTSRISPEAPVPVVHVGEIEERPGGAGNVALNITAVGGRATVHGLIGDDEAGVQLTKILEHSINDITTTLIDNGYSHAFEREADNAAVVILQRAGYNPNGLVDILKVMEERLDPEGKDFAKTHPSPASRIAEIQEITGDYAEVNTPKGRQERFETALGNM